MEKQQQMSKIYFKKYLLSLTLISIFALSCATAPQKIDSSLVLTNGNISAEVSNLFEKTSLPHPRSLSEAIEFSQEGWLRKKGSERWQMQSKFDFDPSAKEAVKHSFAHLLMTSAVIPQQKHYDFVLIMGATAQTMRERFTFFLDMWKNKGIYAPKIIFLVGQRPIDPLIEGEKILNGGNPQAPMLKKLPPPLKWMPKDETEIAQLIVHQATLPQGLSKDMILFSDTPMQKSLSGSVVRPDTTDTVNYWLKNQTVSEGTILAVSSNPVCGYQHAALERALPSNFKLETVGPAAPSTEDFGLYFDSLARWLYQYRD